MNSQSTHTGSATAELEPPAARRIPSERTYHGDTVSDEYAWLADKDDPETIAYLEAENAYTAAVTAGQAGLREEIFAEIKGRTKETDLSVPTRKGGWWYYTRTVEGKQYPVHCRAAVRPGETGPPSTEDGTPLGGVAGSGLAERAEAEPHVQVAGIGLSGTGSGMHGTDAGPPDATHSELDQPEPGERS